MFFLVASERFEVALDMQRCETRGSLVAEVARDANWRRTGFLKAILLAKNELLKFKSNESREWEQ